MAALSPTYASPGLRWGLALEDHPGAYVEFTEQPGADLGIPDRLGGGKTFCVATIHFGAGRKPVVGWKAIPGSPKVPNGADDISDLWNILCTKTLGRALKRAGYPDDLTDLKALVVWRQRDAEISSIRGGTAQLALAPANPERALDAAGKSDPEAVGADDGEAPNTEAVDAEIVEPEPDRSDPSLVPPSDAAKAELRKAINGLGGRSSELTRWAREQGIRVTKPATEAEALRLIEQAAVIAAGPAEPEAAPPAEPESAAVEVAAEAPPAEDTEDLAGQVIDAATGLTKEEGDGYVAFLKSLEVDPKSDPRTWDASVLVEVLGWLAVDG